MPTDLLHGTDAFHTTRTTPHRSSPYDTSRANVPDPQRHASTTNDCLPPFDLQAALLDIAHCLPDFGYEDPSPADTSHLIWRALGLLPGPRALAAPNLGTTPNCQLPATGGQYRGDYRIGLWNAQALFACDPCRHARKAKYVNTLMAKLDILLITEAHGTETANSTWRPPLGCSAWWSDGHTSGTEGVGIIVRNSFLANFSAPPKWNHIHRGRAARLQLKGSKGNMDIIVAYFHSGNRRFREENNQEEDTLHDGPNMRKTLRQHIARHI